MPFGGAGRACTRCRKIGISEMIIPAAPESFALKVFWFPFKRDFVVSRRLALTDFTRTTK